MDEKYRLVFRGEILEGQHRAVVQRRLKLAFEYNAGQLERLFSGSAVVLKRSVDKETAARYQALFKKVGGRLMVFREKDDPQAVARKPAAPQSGRTVQDPPASAEKSVGAELAAAEERAAGLAPAAEQPTPPAPAPEEAPAEVDLDTLLAESATAEELRALIEAPDFSLAQVGAVLVDVTEEEVFEVPEADFSLAQVGVVLVDVTEEEEFEVPDADFSLADTGADILPDKPPAPEAAAVGDNYDLAEVGADMGIGEPEPSPAPPDTSHLSVLEQA